MIELIAVYKTFNAGRPNEYAAVRDVSLTIPLGKVSVLQGPSGSGKTTLLSLVGCMVRPSAGRILLHDPAALHLDWAEAPLEITSLPERFLTAIRRQAFGFVFQQFNLIRGISVLENVLLPGYPTGRAHGELQRRGLALLEQLGIGRHRQQPVEALSGGEQQRVAIARALINDPAVIIADEPTAHLDSALSREFLEIVAGLRRAGTTVVIASHDPLVYTAPGVDQLLELRDGALIPATPAP